MPSVTRRWHRLLLKNFERARNARFRTVMGAFFASALTTIRPQLVLNTKLYVDGLSMVVGCFSEATLRGWTVVGLQVTAADAGWALMTIATQARATIADRRFMGRSLGDDSLASVRSGYPWATGRSS